MRADAVLFGVGDLDINVGLLFDPTLGEDVQAIFRLNQCRSQLLGQALAGDDQFVQFLSGEEVDYSVFDLSPLCPFGPIPDSVEFEGEGESEIEGPIGECTGDTSDPACGAPTE